MLTLINTCRASVLVVVTNPGTAYSLLSIGVMRQDFDGGTLCAEGTNQLQHPANEASEATELHKSGADGGFGCLSSTPFLAEITSGTIDSRRKGCLGPSMTRPTARRLGDVCDPARARAFSFNKRSRTVAQQLQQCLAAKLEFGVTPDLQPGPGAAYSANSED